MDAVNVTMLVKVELLPCPFCGGVPTFWNVTGKIHIDCMNEHCFAKPYVFADTMEEAAKMWNTRKEGAVHHDES